jgi:subtilisin family serine protease
MRGTASLAGVVAAGLVLWAAAAEASGGPSPARSPAVGVHTAPLSAAKLDVQPRALRGVPAHEDYAFLLRLGVEPTARAYYSTLSDGRSTARTAARNQLAAVRAAEDRVIATLPGGSHVLFETHAVLAGVAVYTKATNVPALQRISGVEAVYPIAPKTPSLSYSVLLQRAPQAWTAYSDVGANSKIAIIDTGIDYTHADFGGSGDPAEYKAALATDTAAPHIPDPGKVAGGFDFVGDSYDADPLDSGYQPTPHPDPNPLDCGSHGTHVAGIAAGYGENPDGSTFKDDYTTLPTDASSYQDLFRVGPGMAPKAKLYAYKVFGCEGSTQVITAAIDKAVDPNGDGNPSDHADVINMSLGSDFASPQDADSVAANAASQLGVTVVAAAGNGGDLYDVAGSPGNATQVIAAANSVDEYSQLDSLHVGAPAGIANAYPAERSIEYDWANDPDLSGTVVALTQTTNKDGCDTLNATDAARVSGKIAFFEWTDDDATRRCGSAARSANAATAGAIGAIFADDENSFAAGITGSASIPVVLVTKSAGDAIRGALGSGVTITGTSANDFRQLIVGTDDEVSTSSSRGIGDAGDLKPDVSAVGTSVFSASMGTGDQGISFTGTSMASPMVAGLAALVRSKNPGWSPEQVKADIMNTADQDLFTGANHTGNLYGPGRVGAGRIDAKAALDNQVLAYVAGDKGAVSASFGPLAVSTPTTVNKTIDVVNKGGNSATYSVAYQALTQVPGASYSVSPSSVTIAAGQTKTVTLTLTITPSQLTKPIDPTVSRSQAGFAREYLAEASGRVLFTSSGRPTLRVPVYAAPRPAATMTQPSSLELQTGKVQKASLPLSGEAISQGTGLNSIASIVAGFELQATSVALPSCSGSLTTGCIHAGDELAADLKYVGTTSNAPELDAVGQNPLGESGLVYFAITTQGPWRTPVSANEYDIYIDSTGDGKPDYVLFDTRLPDSDIFVSALYNLATDEVDDVEPIDDRLGNIDAAVFDSDTLVMPAAIGALSGVSSTHSRITYGILTFSSFAPGPVDSLGVQVSGNSVSFSGPLTTDVLHPGLAVYGSFNGTGSALLYHDSPGTLVVRRDASSYKTDHGMGALVVHFQDAVGHAAQVVNLTSDHTPQKVAGLKIKVNRHKHTAKAIFRGTDQGHGSKGLRFTCKLDKKHFKSCRSPKLYKHLHRGKHTLQVKAIDKAGNVSKPVKKKFKV